MAEKRRYAGLDVFRVISVLVICAFHTTCHLGCDYGILQPVSVMGAVFMTAFFMLSGFSIYINYASENLQDIQQLKKFYLKRAVGILPMYYIAAVIYGFLVDRGNIREMLLLFPIEVTGLQSVFSSLFGYSHNGGTWFVSCILICYLLYPFLQNIVIQINVRVKLLLIAICTGILLYSPIVVLKFATADIYANPFFRVIEFFTGVLLASVRFELSENKVMKKIIFSKGGGITGRNSIYCRSFDSSEI